MGEPTLPAADVRHLVAAARERLRAAPHAPAAREASLLMAHVLGWSEAQVLARDDRRLDGEQVRAFERLVARREAGEPVAYLTGEREFYGRPFAVDPRVLIPRPETEHLVEAALGLDLPAEPLCLDLATGSGCVAVTLALEVPTARIVASDRSPGALAVARRNAAALGAAPRVRCLGADWTAGLDLARFDLVTANPPYVAPAEASSLSPEITRFEPPQALFAEAGGLAAFARIFDGLSALRPGTPVACEVGRGQAAAVAGLAAERGFAAPRSLADYAGVERVVVVIRGR